MTRATIAGMDLERFRQLALEYDAKAEADSERMRLMTAQMIQALTETSAQIENTARALARLKNKNSE